MADVLLLLVVLILNLFIVLYLMAGIRIIQPYEQGLLIVYGSFKRELNPGFNYVIPFVSRVVKIDLRTQKLEIPKQEFMVADESTIAVDALMYVRVVNPKRAYFEISNYRAASVALAETTLRTHLLLMEQDEIMADRFYVNKAIREKLNDDFTLWGLKVETFELGHVVPLSAPKRTRKPRAKDIEGMRRELAELEEKSDELRKRIREREEAGGASESMD
jgi:regulator of protease activity HflC (stomatin/prohibitin superfamily)